MMLEALVECCGIVTAAADMVGIERTSHYRWMDSDPVYKKAVADIDNVALDFVENELFAQIAKGEAASTIFYLKTKGKKRGYIERQEFAMVDTEPSEIKLPSGRVVAI